MVFEAITGQSFDGDISIDDIRIRDGPCNPFGNCNFETGDTCTWMNSNDGTDNFDWMRQQGGTLSDNTGPSIDHTLGSAYGKIIVGLVMHLAYAFIHIYTQGIIANNNWVFTNVFLTMYI